MRKALCVSIACLGGILLVSALLAAPIALCLGHDHPLYWWLVGAGIASVVVVFLVAAIGRLVERACDVPDRQTVRESKTDSEIRGSTYATMRRDRIYGDGESGIGAYFVVATMLFAVVSAAAATRMWQQRESGADLRRIFSDLDKPSPVVKRPVDRRLRVERTEQPSNRRTPEGHK